MKSMKQLINEAGINPYDATSFDASDIAAIGQSYSKSPQNKNLKALAQALQTVQKGSDSTVISGNQILSVMSNDQIKQLKALCHKLLNDPEAKINLLPKARDAVTRLQKLIVSYSAPSLPAKNKGQDFTPNAGAQMRDINPNRSISPAKNKDSTFSWNTFQP